MMIDCDTCRHVARMNTELPCCECIRAGFGLTSRWEPKVDDGASTQEQQLTETFEQAVDQVFAEMRALMLRKQRDYGQGNISAFGEFGVLVRANDKMERLKNLLGKGREPSNESVEDTWMDLANYAVIALLCRRGLWQLPLGDE